MMVWQHLTELSSQAIASPNFLGDLWSAAKNAGVFGTLFMLVMYWRESKRVDRLQGERDALLREVLNVTKDSTNSMNTTATGFQAVMSSMHAVQITITKVEAILADIEKRRR